MGAQVPFFAAFRGESAWRAVLNRLNEEVEPLRDVHS